MTDEKTSRVAMLWPESLKERVREQVGPRGMTAFTIEAVKARLEGQADTEGSSEADEDQEPVDQQEPAESEPEPPAVGDPGTIHSGEPEGQGYHTPSGPNGPRGVFARVLDQVHSTALDNGVDLSGVDFKPASQVDPASKPADAAPVAPEYEYGHDREGGQCAPEICGGTRNDPCSYSAEEIARFERLEREESAASQPADPPVPVEKTATPAEPNTCPNCGSELIVGECWECM